RATADRARARAAAYRFRSVRRRAGPRLAASRRRRAQARRLRVPVVFDGGARRGTVDMVRRARAVARAGRAGRRAPGRRRWTLKDALGRQDDVTDSTISQQRMTAHGGPQRRGRGRLKLLALLLVLAVPVVASYYAYYVMR